MQRNGAMVRIRQVAMACLVPLGLGAHAAAQEAEGFPRPALNFYGLPGTVDMPNAVSMDDGQLALTVSHWAGFTRTTLAFQVLPRLTGTFRYSRLPDNPVHPNGETFYDRSFDLRFRFLDEGLYRPALAVGLRDFLGTGIYSGEYLVATKTLRPGLRVSGGLGWGRLGSRNGFDNPLGVISDRFDERSPRDFSGTGGDVALDEFFAGDAALFAGAEWQVSERLTMLADLQAKGD